MKKDSAPSSYLYLYQFSRITAAFRIFGLFKAQTREISRGTSIMRMKRNEVDRSSVNQ